MAGTYTEPPLNEYQDLSHTIGLITELVVLDEAWTREAKASSDPATRDGNRVEQLSGVVERLDQLYGELGALGPRLSEIFRSRDQLLRERYEALVADDAAERPQIPRIRSLTTDERRNLRSFVEEHGRGDVVDLVTKPPTNSTRNPEPSGRTSARRTTPSAAAPPRTATWIQSSNSGCRP